MHVDATHNISLKEMDKERVFHPNTSIADHLANGPFVVGSGKGVTLTDIDGKDYIDCGAGLWCMNIGYGRDEIAEVARAAIQELGYFHQFASASTEPIIRLADKVLRLLHDEADATHLSKVFFGCSGSDANDTNYKLIRYYNNLRGRPQKKKMIALSGGYHGLTYATAGLTGITAYHKAFDVPLEGIFHTHCPHFFRFGEAGESEDAFCDRMVAGLVEIIDREGADTIAAFFAEPVMGVGGVITPPRGYFAKVQEVLRANDILFVADEVITGFGRTGAWFATGLFGLKPDIVNLAKGITSGYFPTSASVISEGIWDVLRNGSPEFGPVMHGFTYSGHPVGGAIGVKVQEIMERENLVQNARDVGAYFLQKLRGMIGDHPYVGEVRGEGLMMGVEFLADKENRRAFAAGAGPHKIVSGKCFAEGVLARALPYIEVVAFSPPLCMTRAEADEAVRRFARGLDAATPALEALADQ